VRSKILVLALLLGAATSALHALDCPPMPNRWATDRAGILSTTELSLLDSKLENFEKTSGAQFIVYIFSSIEDDAIEDFTIRCAREWKVGQPKIKNGVVLFVFVKDRKARIEVGDALEGTVTDAFASRVIREILAPPFQRGAYGEGLNAAADAIIQKIKTGEEPVPQAERHDEPASGSDVGSNAQFVIFIVFMIVVFVVLPMLTRGRRRSGCGGCLPLFLPFGGGGSGITFGGGGFSGGGRFSGGGGGGGFSGGGGGFSGGGATGGW